MSNDDDIAYRKQILENARKAREGFLRDMMHERRDVPAEQDGAKPVAKSPADFLRDRMLRS